MTDSKPIKNAPLWRRLCAMTYDTFLLAGVILAYVAIHLFIKYNFLSSADIELSPTAGGDPLMFINLLIVIFLFFYLFWRKNGQTLGMQTWLLKIEQKNGKNISVIKTLTRLIVAPIGLLFFGLGYLWCFFGPRQCWQDIVSQTQTIVIEKNK